MNGLQFSVFAIILLALLSGCLNRVSVEEAEDWARFDLLHSDIPLFGLENDEVWPTGFWEENSFGCTSRVTFGDWKLTPTAPDKSEVYETWYRVENYGVMHCFALVSSADERQSLEGSEARPAYFVRLQTKASEEDGPELWALQLGARPGSDYLLLSRSPSDGLVESFEVLQIDCPPKHVRDGGNFSILITDYCSINTREAFLELAEQMLAREPIGTLIFVSDTPS